MKRVPLLIVLASILSFAITTTPAMAQTGADAISDVAADIVAKQIRKQGYAC